MLNWKSSRIFSFQQFSTLLPDLVKLKLILFVFRKMKCCATLLVKLLLTFKFIIRAGEWELAAEGDPETPLERYNRLRCEFSELLEQVTEQRDKATESEKVLHIFLLSKKWV